MPAAIRLLADAAVLVAEAGLRDVGGNGAGAHGANEGQGSDDAQSDLLHKRTPIENTKPSVIPVSCWNLCFLDTQEPLLKPGQKPSPCTPNAFRY